MAEKEDKVARLNLSCGAPVVPRLPEKERAEMVAMLRDLLQRAEDGRLFSLAVAAEGIDTDGHPVGHMNWEVAGDQAGNMLDLYLQVERLHRAFQRIMLDDPAEPS